MISAIFSRVELRVLVVCTANICRSPAAEALLRNAIKKSNLGRKVKVVSAGTRVAAPGRRPDPRILQLCQRQGISTRGLRSSQVTDRDVSEANFVWAMDSENLTFLVERFPSFRDKFDLFDMQSREIIDPYFGSRKDVRDAFDVLRKASDSRCGALEDLLT